jgi:hypothetical protein
MEEQHDVLPNGSCDAFMDQVACALDVVAGWNGLGVL